MKPKRITTYQLPLNDTVIFKSLSPLSPFDNFCHCLPRQKSVFFTSITMSRGSIMKLKKFRKNIDIYPTYFVPICCHVFQHIDYRFTRSGKILPSLHTHRRLGDETAEYRSRRRVSSRGGSGAGLTVLPR